MIVETKFVLLMTGRSGSVYSTRDSGRIRSNSYLIAQNNTRTLQLLIRVSWVLTVDNRHGPDQSRAQAPRRLLAKRPFRRWLRSLRSRIDVADRLSPGVP